MNACFVIVFVSVMTQGQFNFISTLPMTRNSVRLSFSRINIPHFDNTTEIHGVLHSVYNKNVGIINTIRGSKTSVFIYDNDRRETIKSVKLNFVPMVTVPGTYSTRGCCHISVNSMFCNKLGEGFLQTAMSSGLGYCHGLDLCVT